MRGRIFRHSTDMHTLQVPEQARGERLDRFLVNVLRTKSRSMIQKEISRGRIRLNDKLVTPHHFLKGGERITLDAASAPPITTPNALGEVKMLFSDDDVAVIEKPAGLLVHPAKEKRERTLLDWLAEHIPETTRVGNPERPGIVHRLDRDVSGVLVVAKSAQGYQELIRAFKERHVEKIYTAIVAGRIERDEGVITFPIRRSRRGSRMAAVPHTRRPWKIFARMIGARPAETHFTVLERLTHATLIEVRLITGRSHQIRVHFFASGHPVLGDPIYPAKEKPRAPLERIYLHATSLSFPLFGSLRGPFISQLPEPFERLLVAIRPTRPQVDTGKNIR